MRRYPWGKIVNNAVENPGRWTLAYRSLDNPRNLARMIHGKHHPKLREPHGIFEVSLLNEWMDDLTPRADVYVRFQPTMYVKGTQ